MVVHNGDLRRTIGGPLEYNPPLVVDPNRVPTSTLSAQGLKAVAGRDRHVLDPICGIQRRKFAGGDPCDLRETTITLRVKKLFSVFIRKGENHSRASFLPTHQRWDGFFEWGAEFFQWPSEGFAGGFDSEGGVFGDFSEAGVRDASGFEEVEDFAVVVRGEGDDDAGLGFVEEGDIGAGAGDFGFGSEVSAHAGFGEVDGEAAFGAVVGAADEALADEVADGVLDSEFLRIVELRRGAGFAAVDGEEVVRSAEFVAGFADEEDDVTRGFEGLGGDVFGFFDEADHADGGRGVDGSGGGFVVEAHIAASDGCVECAAGFGETFDCFPELEEIFGFVRISEIQVVCDGERDRAGAGDIAGGFGDGDATAFARVLLAVDRVAIGGGGQNFIGFADEEDGGIRAWEDGGAEADHVVVLLPDPALRGDARVGEEFFQRGNGIGLRHAGEVEGLGSVFGSGFAGVERGFVGELAGGDFDGDFVAFADAHHAVVIDHTNMGVGEIPFFKDGTDFVFLTFFDDDEHAFLGLGEQDFVRRHAGFAFRHEVDVDFNACSASAGGFASGAGEAGGAHVLDTGDAATGEEFEAGFEEEFFAEGVADLHGWAVFLGFLGEFA